MFSEWSESWGRDAAAMLLDRHPDVDAIACGSAQIARGVLDTLRDLGRRVPEDVAVIGYDNWEVLTTNARPELTSIDATSSNSAGSRRAPSSWPWAPIPPRALTAPATSRCVW